MLKHTTPRSSPSLSGGGSPSPSGPFPISAIQPNGVGEDQSVIETKKCVSKNNIVVIAEVHKKSNISENDLNNVIPLSSILPSSLRTPTKNPNVETIYNERGVDCEGILSQQAAIKKSTNPVLISRSSFWSDKIFNLSSLSASGGAGIGPVITHGKAIVKRGLSFSSKKDNDAVSVRSVKSDGVLGANCYLAANMKPNIVIDHKDKNGNNQPMQPKTTSNNSEFKESQNKSITSSKSGNRRPNLLRSSARKILRLSKRDHPSLKSLLRLPGVYGHIPVPENAPCGSPHVLSADSLSLDSSADSFASSGRTSARSWASSGSAHSDRTSDSANSNCSSNSEPSSTTLRIFARCLRSDIEYKTVHVGPNMTCHELVHALLSKARMRHRDPNLFYLTMEVTVRRWSGMPVRALLVLEPGARPAQLCLCRPAGHLRFVLQMRRGGLIRIHDTVLTPTSQYKSLLVSFSTTAAEAVQLLLRCCGRTEAPHNYALHEVCQSPQYCDRRLSSEEKPLELKSDWPRDRSAQFVFVLRRNMTHALSLRKLSLRNSERLQSRVAAEAVASFSTQQTMIDCTQITPIMVTFRSDQQPTKILHQTKTISKPTANTDQSCLSGSQSKAYGKPQNVSWSESYLARRCKTPSEGNKGKRIIETRCNGSGSTLTYYPKVTDCQWIEKYPAGNTSIVSPVLQPKSEQNRLLSDRSLQLQKQEFEALMKSNSTKANSQLNKNEPDKTIRDEKHFDDNCRIALQITNKSKQASREKTKMLSRSHGKLNLISNDFSKEALAIKNLTKISCDDLHLLSQSLNPAKMVTPKAVQTELTCIPVRGLRTNHKWNSVETLLDTRKSKTRLKINTSLDNANKKCTKEKSVVCTRNSNGPTDLNHKIEKHERGKQCNCQNCFYI